MVTLIRTISIIVLSILLMTSIVIGYNFYEKKNNVQLQVENNYQRAFHNLVYHIDDLHDQIGTAIVMNSDQGLSPQFVDIWRTSARAQEEISHLPLHLLPVQHTATFLNDIQDFTYATTIRNLDDDPLSEDELDKLEVYFKQLDEIKSDLQEAQATTLNKGLTWEEVEIALLDGKDNSENQILDSFRRSEEVMEDFSETNQLTEEDEKDIATFVNGQTFTEDKVIDKTLDMFYITDEAAIEVEESLEGASLNHYNVTYDFEDGDLFMDVTEKGGLPITFIVNRELADQTISLNDGVDIAQAYLSFIGYDNMTLFESKQFGNEGVFTFVYEEEDIKMLPDAISVKVALDNGEVIGLNAREFLLNHKKRQLNRDLLSEKEAREYVNDDVTIEEAQLVLTRKDDDEVLSYLFLARYKDDTYEIYIDAQNGEELRVKRNVDLAMSPN